jgi:hypothetical protein
MLAGKYPTIKEALQRIDNGHRSVAFTRNFAIDHRDRALKYRDRKIGRFDLTPWGEYKLTYENDLKKISFFTRALSTHMEVLQ